MNHWMTRHAGCMAMLLCALFCAAGVTSVAQQSAAGIQAQDQWPTYGGDAGGQRYSSAQQINKDNVQQLQPAWTLHTGDNRGAFEATPILFEGLLYFASPVDQVFAVDPATGVKRWSYNPHLRMDRELGIVTSRGVASWSGPGPAAGAACASRIFVGTLDARLIAIDAVTGALCTDFGDGGTVDLTQNVDYVKGDNYAVSSPPTVVGDVVVVGSAIADNFRVDVELGDVRGFDVRSGKLLWTWEPIPWAKQQKLRTGAGNTWAAMSADTERGLLYLPVSSPSPDYYGGNRPGDDRDADSIVALDVRTGRKVWAFQIVHHDIWDYDLAAEPLLFTWRGTTPAVAVATKMGLVFVFNRVTGEPLFPITERPVPQSDVPGEVTSPTQPFPALAPLVPLTLDLSGPLGANPAEDVSCRKILTSLRYDGIYTPASLRGSLLFPSNVGGVNWGSAALDPATGILYADTNRIPFKIQLTRRPFLNRFMSSYAQRYFFAALAVLLCVLIVVIVWRKSQARGRLTLLLCLMLSCSVLYGGRGKLLEYIGSQHGSDYGGIFAQHFGKEVGDDKGVPYILLREPVKSVHDSCSPPPWGTVAALNLNTGQTAWQSVLGITVDGKQNGGVNVGGPIVTAGGLVFTGAAEERFLRAFDSATGKELWRGALPFPAHATPMTYMYQGRQYVVTAAGGHSGFGETGDTMVAFALP